MEESFVTDNCMWMCWESMISLHMGIRNGKYMVK